jgi:hypothetical protein
MGSLAWLVAHHVIRLVVVEECETSKLISFISCNKKLNFNELSQKLLIQPSIVYIYMYVCMYVHMHIYVEREKIHFVVSFCNKRLFTKRLLSLLKGGLYINSFFHKKSKIIVGQL